MSRELVKNIYVKKNEVYITTKSNNVSGPYYSSKYDRLSELYKNEGQKGLDKYFIECGLSSFEFIGEHKNILPYKKAIEDYWRSDERHETDKLDDMVYTLWNELNIYELKDLVYFYRDNCTKLYDKAKDYIELYGYLEEAKTKRLDKLLGDVEKFRNEIEQEKENTNQDEFDLELISILD